MKRRDLIRVDSEKQRRMLETSKTIILSTIDRHGYPHSVAMWYVMEDGCAVMTTYAKSQKAVNIRRNPKVALLVETGIAYDALTGVLIRGRAQLIEDPDTCVSVLSRVHEKMTGAVPAGIEEALKLQARKRVVIKVIPERVTSWDHSKLAGAY